MEAAELWRQGQRYKRIVLQTLPRQHEEDRVKRKSEVYEFRFPLKCTSDQDFGASSLLGYSLEAQ